MTRSEKAPMCLIKSMWDMQMNTAVGKNAAEPSPSDSFYLIGTQVCFAFL